jgi:hypothetical protein
MSKSNKFKPIIKTHKKIHNDSYKNTLGRVRKHYSRPKNVFSRVLHANGMDSVHEYLAFTLIHPKILLSGASTALTGQLISILAAEYYGYSYNYFLFLYYFGLGYTISLIYLTITVRLRK